MKNTCSVCLERQSTVGYRNQTLGMQCLMHVVYLTLQKLNIHRVFLKQILISAEFVPVSSRPS